jgi:hypothetical protein
MQNSPRTIQIGLTAADAAWNLMLRQIGIASKVISPTDDLYADYSVIIVIKDADQTIQQNIAHYVEQGGSLLFTKNAMHGIADVPTVTKKVTSLPPTKNEHYEYYGILDLHSSLKYFANGDFVHSIPAGNGYKYYVGFDLAELLTTAAKRKNFYTPAGRMPNEVVSSVSKGTLRQLIFSLLKGMHHRQSLPFIHLWYYPGTERTIFTFRIDSDKGTQEQVEEIRALSERHVVPTTWFLDVKSHESWLPSFRSFGDQEIALHCYEHILYRTASLNRENFQKALTLMKNAGLTPKGITAPTGGWNNAYAESIRELGFSYSSEFSYDYDDLPSFPVLNGVEFPIPQLPIHPICVGTMLRAQMSDDEMVRYFRSYIDAQLALNEPICLYQHPTHGHNGVFEEVFQYIDSLSIAKLSYTDYAEWWKHRNDSITAVTVSNGMIEAESETGNVLHRVIFPDGRECLTALSELLKTAALEVEQKNYTIQIPADIMRSRTFDIRHLLQNSLDWWIKTTE